MGACLCCHTLLVLLALILAYYTILFVGDHSEAKAVWHVAAMKVVIQALLPFLFVMERSVVGYNCRDPRMDHGGRGVITPLQSCFQRRINQYDFA